MKQPRIQADYLFDAASQMLRPGDRATLNYIDRRYLYGLPSERQDVYEAWLGKIVTIVDADDCGAVAIAFHDESGRQEFWIEPGWLLRMPI